MTAYSAQGSASAFQTLYARYESRLFGFFVKRLSSPTRDRASDLFQKTWLKVHAARQSYGKGRKFSPWLFSIALNTLRDELKRKDLTEELGPEDPQSATSDAEAEFARSEDRIALEKTLENLSGPDREALILSEWEGLSPAELGEVWQVSAAAARQRVSRARKRAREFLTGTSLWGVASDE